MNLFLFLTVLDLCCCTRAFSSCIEWGLLFVAAHQLLIAVAPPCCQARAPGSTGFSSRSTWT